mmetsp:Transcript_23071/g.25897  ORF Transcript_23071/g.25897 Transcript_23071/m.25897 type:complete len:91 (+) Transcript_23071:34-306(+)
MALSSLLSSSLLAKAKTSFSSKNIYRTSTTARRISKQSTSLFSMSSSSSSSSSPDGSSIYSLSGVQSDGSSFAMAETKGKVIYATNVASH